MKKVITLILLIACGCSKDTPADKACYSCLVKTTSILLTGSQTATKTDNYCGITADDAKGIEVAGTTTVNGTTGDGKPLTIKTETTCTKKQ